MGSCRSAWKSKFAAVGYDIVSTHPPPGTPRVVSSSGAAYRGHPVTKTAGPFTLVPYFMGELHAPRRRFTLTVVSEWPIELQVLEAQSAVAGSGEHVSEVVNWTYDA